MPPKRQDKENPSPHLAKDQEVTYDESLHLTGYEVSLTINKGFKTNEAAVNFLQQKCLINVQWIDDYCLGFKIINSSEKTFQKEQYLPPLIIPNDPKIKSLDLSGLIDRWYSSGALLSMLPDVDVSAPKVTSDRTIVDDDDDDDNPPSPPVAMDEIAMEEDTLVNNDCETDTDTDADEEDEDNDEQDTFMYSFPCESSKLAQTLKDSGSYIFSTGNASFQRNSLHGADCKCKVFPCETIEEVKEYIKIYNIAKSLWYNNNSYESKITYNEWLDHDRRIDNPIVDSTSLLDSYQPIVPRGLFPCDKLSRDYSTPSLERLWNNCLPPFSNDETKEIPEFVTHSCIPGERQLSKSIKHPGTGGEVELQELCSSNNGGESIGRSSDKTEKEIKEELNEWWNKVYADNCDLEKHRLDVLQPMIELHQRKHESKIEELDKRLFKKFQMDHKPTFDTINPGQHLQVLMQMKKWYMFKMSKEVKIQIAGIASELKKAKFLWVDVMPIIKNFAYPHTLMSYEKNSAITLVAFPIKNFQRTITQSEDNPSKMTVRCILEFFKRAAPIPSSQLEYAYQQDIKQPIKDKSKRSIKVVKAKSPEEKIAEKERKQQEKLMNELTKAEKQKNKSERQMEAAEERWFKAQEELLKSQIKRKNEEVDSSDEQESSPAKKQKTN